MLMLGESVLSLLIVQVVESWEYYQVFLSGLISIILFQYLHFAATPHDPDQHAMRRNSKAGMTFSFLMVVYSIGLVIVGACVKMLLYEIVYQHDDTTSAHRTLLQRVLAGSSSAALRFSTQDRQQRIAHLFSGSVTVVWFCLDGMTFTHIGWDAKKAKYNELTSTPLKVLYWVCMLLRLGLLILSATMSQWVTKPTTLSWLGLMGVISQLALRGVILWFFPCAVFDDHNNSSMDLIAKYARARQEEIEAEKACNRKEDVGLQ
jgi:hypothetical protein